MWPTLANLGGVKITIFGIALAIGFLWASFQVWRKMREDYPEEEVLTLTVFLTVLGLLTVVGWRWWTIGGSLVIPILGLVAWTRRKAWNFWEWLDALGPISLMVGVIASVGWGLDQLYGAGVLLVGSMLVAWLSSRYRRFRWYKSGRVGFVGVTSIMWWMLSWILIAKWRSSTVYLGGLVLEQWLAIWIIVACATVLYVRGGRRITHDVRRIRNIWQKPKKNQ